MEAPDVVELLNQIGLRNAQELKLLIEDTENLMSVAEKYEQFYQKNHNGKKILSLLFDNYPFIPESSHDLVSILQKTQRVFQFFTEQDVELNEQELEKGVKLAYKLIYKILYSQSEDVFRKEYLESLKKEHDNTGPLKKLTRKNRYNFIIMLRVIIDHGYMIWSENISYFGPMFRDRLEIYHLKEEIMDEVVKTTDTEEISFFVGVYLYVFFVIPRSTK